MKLRDYYQNWKFELCHIGMLKEAENSEDVQDFMWEHENFQRVNEV